MTEGALGCEGHADLSTSGEYRMLALTASSPLFVIVGCYGNRCKKIRDAPVALRRLTSKLPGGIHFQVSIWGSSPDSFSICCIATD